MFKNTRIRTRNQMNAKRSENEIIKRQKQDKTTKI